MYVSKQAKFILLCISLEDLQYGQHFFCSQPIALASKTNQTIKLLYSKTNAYRSSWQLLVTYCQKRKKIRNSCNNDSFFTRGSNKICTSKPFSKIYQEQKYYQQFKQMFLLEYPFKVCFYGKC